jgi:YD repeat-containing protein
MIGLNARMTTLLAAGSSAGGTPSGTLSASSPTTTWPSSTAAHEGRVTLSNGTLVTVTYDRSGAITSVTTRTGTGHPAPAN